MDWTERFNEVIDYIEEHLTEDIDYGALARIALCSTYHFQRMFAYIAGVPLSEYIRRRRMSLAAVDLQSGERVIDIGLKYGYSSPTAFNRAFQSVHGVAPSALRSEGAGVKSFPPLRFKLTVRGVEELNYRIETRGDFRIVGRSYPLSREIEQNFLEVPQMWQGGGRGRQPGADTRAHGRGTAGRARRERLRRRRGVALLHSGGVLRRCGGAVGGVYGPRLHLGHLPGSGDGEVDTRAGAAHRDGLAPDLRL